MDGGTTHDAGEIRLERLRSHWSRDLEVPPPWSPVASARLAGLVAGQVKSRTVACRPVSASVVVGVMASSTRVTVYSARA